LAAGVLAAFVVSRHVYESVPPPVHVHDPAQAAELRKQAYADLAAGHYSACLDRLDQASKLDPEGDSDPAVQSARDRATRALSNAPGQGRD
jgi:hypothetical protein